MVALAGRLKPAAVGTKAGGSGRRPRADLPEPPARHSAHWEQVDYHLDRDQNLDGAEAVYEDASIRLEMTVEEGEARQ